MELIKRLWPKTRKASLLLAVLVLVLLLFLASMGRKQEEAKNQGTSPKITLNQVEREKMALDSDSDGLKNWEEIIFQTDSKNPDTDGDGTKDGDEVKIGRNPLKKGPDDEFSAPRLAEENSPYFAPDNLTGKLAEKFGINVIVPRLSGSSRPLDFEGIGNQIISETLSGTASPQNYFTEKDIKISNDNGKEALRAYDKATDEIIVASFKNLSKSPLQTFADAVQTDNFSGLAALDSYIRAYDTAIEKLKKVSVPQKAASLHVIMLNALARQREGTKAMRGAENDILKGVVGARSFAETIPLIKDAVQQFQIILHATQ